MIPRMEIFLTFRGNSAKFTRNGKFFEKRGGKKRGTENEFHSVCRSLPGTEVLDLIFEKKIAPNILSAILFLQWTRAENVLAQMGIDRLRLFETSWNVLNLLSCIYWAEAVEEVKPISDKSSKLIYHIIGFSNLLQYSLINFITLNSSPHFFTNKSSQINE